MYLTEKEIIYSTDERFNLIKDLCHLSKNLYNASLYDVRQYYFETKSYRTWQSQVPIFTKTKNTDYYALQSHVASEVIKQVGRQFISFFNNKSNKKKRIPKYKDKNGYNVVTFNNRAISRKIEFDEDKQLYTHTLCKKSYNLKIQSTKSNIKMVKFVYDEVNDLIKCYKIYEVEQPKLKNDNSRYFSIDPGLNNIVAIYNNIGIRPLLYNGRPIKSINQYYNKTTAKLRSELPTNIKSSKRLKQLSLKRNNKIDYEMHKISTHIINEAVKNNISKIFIGNNIGWKNEINIGRRNNQNFVNIPHTKLFNQLLYKGSLNDIEVIFTEESYTSRASFFDKDELPIYDETSKYKFSGRRIKRGLYKDSKGNIWNADLNGAANIMRKCSDKAYKGIRKTKEMMRQPILITL
jgi:IS605 OrfB family transposase|uniref:Transposase n=1 Tax=Siphoviridae sp. ctHip2 TaxID=2827830 RepID=A0A8S5RVD4_9CAUD|nr:MAG TPA: transposase [Siphoviridae sp. ctHip2]